MGSNYLTVLSSRSVSTFAIMFPLLVQLAASLDLSFNLEDVFEESVDRYALGDSLFRH